MALLVSAPMGLSMLVGIVVSILQAAGIGIDTDIYANYCCNGYYYAI